MSYVIFNCLNIKKVGDRKNHNLKCEQNAIARLENIYDCNC